MRRIKFGLSAPPSCPVLRRGPDIGENDDYFGLACARLDSPNTGHLLAATIGLPLYGKAGDIIGDTVSPRERRKYMA